MDDMSDGPAFGQVSRRGLLKVGAAAAALGAATEVSGLGSAMAAPAAATDEAALLDAFSGPRKLLCYATIVGQRQGKIKGGVKVKSHEGTIECFAYSHEITSPRDPVSGLPTGRRQHKPVIIAKEWDAATPKLFQALVTNENLTSVLLEFPGVAAGRETIAFTIKLTNASIADIADETAADGHEDQRVTFTYQRIEWTWTDGGITVADDWDSERT